MAVCDDARANLVWQFDVNAQEGDLKAESPLSAYNGLFQFCHYDPSSAVVIPSSGFSNFAQVEDAYFILLEWGQRHNPPAAATYRACRNSRTFWPFAEDVFRSAFHGSDLGNARMHIAWQAGANPGTIQEARSAWQLSSQVVHPDARLFFRTAAMYFLLLGQRHNAQAMSQYRACFRDTPDALFAMVLSATVFSPAALLATVQAAENA